MDSVVNTIHGHDIIDLIRSAPAGFTPEDLATEVTNRFGAAARFHTCSAGGMTLDQLLQFLFMRNKITEREGKLWIVEENVCNHG
jgi:probable metal-binding protein